MSSRIVSRIARAKASEEEARLAALASIEARRARIAAATAKLEVPASKNQMRSAKLPTCRNAPSSAPRRTNPEAWVDTKSFRKASYLKRPATPRFARQPAAPTAACRDGPDPLGQKDLVEASEETLALHRTYGRSYAIHNPAQWDQRRIPCNLISGERLSRKSRPPRRLRFEAGDVTRTVIVSRWMAEVDEEESDEESEEESEKEEESDEESEPDINDEEGSDDWAKAILDDLERKFV
ncbi:hypothetical protein MMC31_003826 [Peltigera leucophlebia]|nr:hypothetical protein [Peltigera leucophlebia]